MVSKRQLTRYSGKINRKPWRSWPEIIVINGINTSQKISKRCRLKTRAENLRVFRFFSGFFRVFWKPAGFRVSGFFPFYRPKCKKDMRKYTQIIEFWSKNMFYDVSCKNKAPYDHFSRVLFIPVIFPGFHEFSSQISTNKGK